MVHPVAADAASSQAVSHLQGLWHDLCDPRTEPREKLLAVLADELDAFGLPAAFLSRVDPDGDRQYFDVVAGADTPIDPGDVIALSESYCRMTLETSEGALVIDDAVEEGLSDHPMCTRLGIRTYLGTTVVAGDDLYGTLCFVSREPRAEPIADREVALVEMLAEWTGFELAVREASRPVGVTADPTTASPMALESSEVDALMDALARRPRRIVLAGLLEGSVETQADLLAGGGPSAGRRGTSIDATELEHNHLPRLADAGFVEWDRETGAIGTGPAFEAVEETLACVLDGLDELD